LVGSAKTRCPAGFFWDPCGQRALCFMRRCQFPVPLPWLPTRFRLWSHAALGYAPVVKLRSNGNQGTDRSVHVHQRTVPPMSPVRKGGAWLTHVLAWVPDLPVPGVLANRDAPAASAPQEDRVLGPNGVHNMAKTLDPVWGATTAAQGAFPAKMFDALERAFKLQLIVCPNSTVHEKESSLASHPTMLRAVYEHLGNGVSFEHPVIVPSTPARRRPALRARWPQADLRRATASPPPRRSRRVDGPAPSLRKPRRRGQDSPTVPNQG